MNPVERVFVAACAGLISAGLVAMVSLALQSAHVWPGVAVGFGTTGLLTFLRMPAEPGRCGDVLSGMSRMYVCELRAGHRGMHREGVTEWGLS